MAQAAYGLTPAAVPAPLHHVLWLVVVAVILGLVTVRYVPVHAPSPKVQAFLSGVAGGWLAAGLIGSHPT